MALGATLFSVAVLLHIPQNRFLDQAVLARFFYIAVTLAVRIVNWPDPRSVPLMPGRRRRTCVYETGRTLDCLPSSRAIEEGSR